MRPFFTARSPWTSLIAVVLLTGPALPGCARPSSQADKPVGDEAGAGPEVSIVAGQSPTDQQQQQMLAAKEALLQRLSARLMEAMGQGPAAAITVCHQEAPKIAKDVGQEQSLRIGRTGVRLRNPDNQPPAWAQPLTEAKTDTPTFVKLSNGNAAALLPIKLQGQCVMCHGPSDKISPVIQTQLAKLYPDDQATGFREGELRGWFWVELPSS